MEIEGLHTTETDLTALDMELGIEELDEMVDPGFWETAAGVAAGTIVGAGVVYGGAVLIAT